MFQVLCSSGGGQCPPHAEAKPWHLCQKSFLVPTLHGPQAISRGPPAKHPKLEHFSHVPRKAALAAEPQFHCRCFFHSTHTDYHSPSAFLPVTPTLRHSWLDSRRGTHFDCHAMRFKSMTYVHTGFSLVCSLMYVHIMPEYLRHIYILFLSLHVGAREGRDVVTEHEPDGT